MSKAETIPYNLRKALLGTFRTSSLREKPDRTPNRPYGGTPMSKARLYAYGPSSRDYVPQVNHDITM